jgi:membrane fusion protein, multidrug efflux system
MLGRSFRYGLLFVIVGASLLGCSKGKEQANSQVGKPAVPVEVAKIATADLTEGIEVVGSLTAKSQADVKAEFAGIVTDLYVTEWVRVQKGTPLARLDTRELDLMLRRLEASVEVARASLLQAEVARNRTERECSRIAKLREAGLVTQQSLDDILTEKDAAGAKLSAANAQVKAAEQEFSQMQTHLSKALIRSPMTGVVSQRNVNVGDLVGDVAGNKILFHIVDNRLLDLTVTAPSREMGPIRVGQPLNFSTDAIPGKTFSGKVTFINPAVNEADRSVRVVADVSNDTEDLKAGLFVKGKIITGIRRGVLQVPRTSLLSWDVLKKEADVFVVNGDKAQRKSIKTGSVSTDLVEVTSGVAAGESVVTRGGFNLKDGETVKVIQGSGR